MHQAEFVSHPQFVLSVALLAAAASAAPRYLIIPLDNVEFVDQEMPSAASAPYPMVYNHRVARQVAMQEEEGPSVYSSPISRPAPGNNRREGIPSFIDAIGAAGIPAAGDNLASGR